VAAVALADALAAVIGPGTTIALKWPNDVLLNGGKVAGILLESAGQGGAVSHLAIGIGVNLAEAPPAAAVEPGAQMPVSVLGETGIRIAPEDFLIPLASAFDRWERRFRTYGFAPIRTAWLARAARIGQPITARTARETITGTFETIAEDGALVLATSQGRRVIPAADVYF
jgi:BirA family biotin operon repressor/biotin-[acetyl-CoA-carboxylase] ligase